MKTNEWDCPNDAKRYKKTVEKNRIYKCLLGLNKSEIRGRILGTKLLPNIQEAFSEVGHEESRKKNMLGSQPYTPATESSALAA